MMPALASKTWTPAKSGTSAVNRARSSTGHTTAMPAASQARWSSSPKPGAMCTMPGALVDGDEVLAEDDEGTRRAGEVREERAVAAPDEIGRP